MVNIISFNEALINTKNIKRHLLLGNGFSIALFPDRFKYDSLLKQADFSAFPQVYKVFEKLKTTDFEVAIHALRQTAILLPLYSSDNNISSVITEYAGELKKLLVQTIAGRHPERPSDISEKQYQACRIFLAHFSGNNRNKHANKEKDLRGCIYTLNYDLLLYWTHLHDGTNHLDGRNSLVETINDAHILKQIAKGKIELVYISLYGNPTAPFNQEIIRRAEKIMVARNERYPLTIQFYDATSA